MTTTEDAPMVTVPRWADLVGELIEQDPALADLLDPAGTPDVIDGHVRLHPYTVLCDVSALIGWAGYLDTPVTCLARPAPGGTGTQLAVRGTLYSVPVELIGETSRPVPGGPGPARITMTALTDLAAAEQTWLTAGDPV